MSKGVFGVWKKHELLKATLLASFPLCAHATKRDQELFLQGVVPTDLYMYTVQKFVHDDSMLLLYAGMIWFLITWVSS
jgi:hypothetical protein